VSQQQFFLKKAISRLREHFITQRNEPRKTPFYQSQLQIFYERDFFSWVVSDALKELVKEGFLTKITETDIPNFQKLRFLTKMSFYVNSEAVNTEEELKKAKEKMFKISKVVDGYSDPAISKTLGDHLEVLVKQELRAQGFEIAGEHTNRFDDKKWTETKHDLDFIAVHRNGKLKVGVEVKNTLSVIPPDEIDIKIKICEYLGIVPIFAVRWIKPYFYCISNQGGFCWMFKTLCYPLGFESFTEELYGRLSDLDKTDSVGHKLEFPINVRKELPEKSVEKLEEWISKKKDDPPTVDSSVDSCSSN